MFTIFYKKCQILRRINFEIDYIFARTEVSNKVAFFDKSKTILRKIKIKTYVLTPIFKHDPRKRGF